MKIKVRWLCYIAVAILVGAGFSSGLTVVGRIELPAYISETIVGPEAVWAIQMLNRGPGPGALIRIDPSLKRIVATVSLPFVSTGSAIAVGSDAVWVSEGRGGENVLRIDPRSNSIVATIPVGISPLKIVVVPTAVWVFAAEREPGQDFYWPYLIKIDPVTNQVSPRIYRPSSTRTAVGHNSLWLINVSPESVERIDPVTDRVIATIPLPRYPFPRDIVIGDGFVWILHMAPSLIPQPGYVSRIDPATNRVIGEPTKLGDWSHIAVGGGYLWFDSYNQMRGSQLSRLDARTLKEVGKPMRISPFASQLLFGFDSVFVVSMYADPHANPNVIQRIAKRSIWGRLFDYFGNG